MKYTAKVIGALLILNLPTMAQANIFSAKYFPTSEAECQNVDFRQNFPLSVRNQGKVSWCYANAAADYLQYAYQLPEQISAADIAINYSKTNFSRFITFFNRIIHPTSRMEPPQTGFIKVAIDQAIPQGYCPEEALPSDEWTRVDSRTQLKSKQEILQSILDSYSLQNEVRAGKYPNAASLPYSFEFKHVNRTDFFNLLKSSSKSTFLLNLRAKACAQERRPFPNRSIDVGFKLRGNHVFQSMNESFNHKMPVSIDFFCTMLSDYDHFKLDPAELHTVLMYGRKYDHQNNECSYLMKNSWGTSCERYDPKIPCEDGFVWIKESKLFRSMTSRLIIQRR